MYLANLIRTCYLAVSVCSNQQTCDSPVWCSMFPRGLGLLHGEVNTTQGI